MGTQIYFYDNYAIVKFNRETIKPDTISINKDLYIGNSAINLDEIK